MQEDSIDRQTVFQYLGAFFAQTLAALLRFLVTSTVRLTQDIPSKVPHIKSILYSDSHFFHNERYLGPRESLHPQHPSNLMKHLVEKQASDRPAGARLGEVLLVPSFAEIQERVAEIVEDQKRKQAEAEKAMRLADRAGLSGSGTGGLGGSGSGGQGTAEAIQTAALLAAMMSESRFGS